LIPEENNISGETVNNYYINATYNITNNITNNFTYYNNITNNITNYETNNYYTNYTTIINDTLWQNISGNATFITGNVGIGTTDPKQKLDVNGNISTSKLTVGNINTIQGSYDSRYKILAKGIIYTENDYVAGLADNAGFMAVVNENNSIYFPYFSGRRSRGNITNPLAVEKGDIFQRMGGLGYDGTGWATSNFASIDFLSDGVTTSTRHPSAIAFLTTTNLSTVLTERARINNQGNLGIGTTEPLYKLSVNGTSWFNGIMSFNPSSSNYLSMKYLNTYPIQIVGNGSVGID
jgi:hypothetical protein